MIAPYPGNNPSADAVTVNLEQTDKLFQAVRFNDVKTVQTLTEQINNPRILNSIGSKDARSLLQVAITQKFNSDMSPEAKSTNNRIISVLIDSGADLNPKNNTPSPLQLSDDVNDPELNKLLAGKGAKYRENEGPSNSLQMASPLIYPSKESEYKANLEETKNRAMADQVIQDLNDAVNALDSLDLGTAPEEKSVSFGDKIKEFFTNIVEAIENVFSSKKDEPAPEEKASPQTPTPAKVEQQNQQQSQNKQQSASQNKEQFQSALAGLKNNTSSVVNTKVVSNATKVATNVTESQNKSNSR